MARAMSASGERKPNAMRVRSRILVLVDSISPWEGTVKLIGGLIVRGVVRRFWWKALSQFTFRRLSWSPR